MQGMRDVPVQTPSGLHSLLSLVHGISAISGGSFTAAYYGLYCDAAFGRFEHDFLYTDTNAYIWGIYLLPWNDRADPRTPATERSGLSNARILAPRSTPPPSAD